MLLLFYLQSPRWMFTLPRTIRVVRGILVMNALVSAFYGLFPVAYLLIDGVLGIMFGGYDWTERVPGSRRQMMLIGTAREGLMGGTTGDVSWKILTRVLPLFFSIKAIKTLVSHETILVMFTIGRCKKLVGKLRILNRQNT
jgi:hypothetical protein